MTVTPSADRTDIDTDLEQAIVGLEDEMADLQLRHRDLFAYANAWAERHDAVMQLAPPHLHDQTSARLRRIAIRWGLADGVRMTAQFPALREA
ncbi:MULTISPECIES: hypothetical protein [unclassified Luteimonas]